MRKLKGLKPQPIVARRTEGFFGEPRWVVTKRSPFSPEFVRGGLSVLSDTEAARLATLPLLEPGEEAEGVGYRGYNPDFFYIEPD